MRRASSSATLPAPPLMRKPLSVGESGALMGKRHFSLIAVGDRLRLVRFGQAVTPRTLRVVAR
jgi:hypothetical protein